MKLLSILLTACLLLPLSSHGETRSYDRSWFGLFGKQHVGNKFFIWNEIQPRMENERFTNQQLLLRPGILKGFSENHEAGFLYGYIYTDDVKENRPTLQLTDIFLQSPSNVISLRNRLEFRIREDQDARSIRYRAALRWQHNISDELGLVLWDEPFLNMTNEKWTGDRVFERNRLFLGSSIKFDVIRLEAGYMNQFTPRKDTSIIEHILTFYLFY